MCQNMKFTAKFRVESLLLSNNVEKVRFCLDDRRFVKQNGLLRVGKIHRTVL